MSARPYHALAVIPDIDQKLLAGIAAGKSLQAVADEYGVSDTAVLNRLRKYDEYEEAIKLSVDLRMGKREAELQAATDNVGVTRADRLLGHARWLAERLDRDRYGQQQQVGIGQVIINLGVSPRNAVPQQAEKVVNNQYPGISISSVNSEE